MTSEDHNQFHHLSTDINEPVARRRGGVCFPLLCFSHASHPAEQHLRKRDVEHLAIGHCFEDGENLGDGPSGVRGLSRSSRCLERTADIRSIDPAFRRPGR
jgi:hypothetical protein